MHACDTCIASSKVKCTGSAGRQFELLVVSRCFTCCSLPSVYISTGNAQIAGSQSEGPGGVCHINHKLQLMNVIHVHATVTSEMRMQQSARQEMFMCLTDLAGNHGRHYFPIQHAVSHAAEHEGRVSATGTASSIYIACCLLARAHRQIGFHVLHPLCPCRTQHACVA